MHYSCYNELKDSQKQRNVFSGLLIITRFASFQMVLDHTSLQEKCIKPAPVTANHITCFELQRSSGQVSGILTVTDFTTQKSLLKCSFPKSYIHTVQCLHRQPLSIIFCMTFMVSKYKYMRSIDTILSIMSVNIKYEITQQANTVCCIWFCQLSTICSHIDV